MGLRVSVNPSFIFISVMVIRISNCVLRISFYQSLAHMEHFQLSGFFTVEFVWNKYLTC